MSTPTDPYNTPTRRPFDEEDVLAPLADENLESAEISQTSADLNISSEDGISEATSFADLVASEENLSSLEKVGAESTEDSAPAPSSLAHQEDKKEEATEISDTDGLPSIYDDPSDEIKQETSLDYRASAHLSSLDSSEESSSSDTSGRTALAASVGLGGISPAGSAQEEPLFFPDQETNTSVGFMPDETPEQSEARRERWANEPTASFVDIPDAPKGRGWAHTGVLFASLLLVPTAWYLISDGHTRLAVAQAASTTNMAGAGELAGGLFVLTLIWLLARASSLGVTVTGILVALFGAFGLIFPTFARKEVLEPIAHSIEGINDFFGNVAHHLSYDTLSGLMFTFGVVLILTGVVSHSTRRRGETHGAILARRELAGN